MTNVVGLEYVKPLLNMQTTVDDAVLTSVIAQAEALVAEKCGPLTATTLTKRVIARGGKLVLPVVPVISVTSVTGVESGTALDLTNDDLVNLAAGVITVTGAWNGVAYDVVYQAGRATLPEPSSVPSSSSPATSSGPSRAPRSTTRSSTPPWLPSGWPRP